MSLNNMKAEFKRAGVTQVDVADSLGMSNNNLNLKVNEKIPMTIQEARFIRDTWLPECTLDVLLQSDGDVPTESERARCRVQAIADNIATDGTPMDAEKAEIVSDLLDSAERCDPAFVNHVLGI